MDATNSRPPFIYPDAEPERKHCDRAGDVKVWHQGQWHDIAPTRLERGMIWMPLNGKWYRDNGIESIIEDGFPALSDEKKELLELIVPPK